MNNIKVGLMAEKHVELCFHGQYFNDGDPIEGIVSLDRKNVKEEMLFSASSPDCSVTVKDVTIGVKFHWERKEDQTFKGDILIKPDAEGNLIVINILSIEDYIASVISSEMSATSQLELLKAHAVISRSWALAQIRNHVADAAPGGYDDDRLSDGGPGIVRVRWYGGNDHADFDVCADDHCQRYQGITRQTTDDVRKAVDATRGLVLMYGDELCDARFSKCCGGAMEVFESCWEDAPKPYLVGKPDLIPEPKLPDLAIEENAVQWILSSPKAFCNTSDRKILSQVLNGYDQETADFYRWKVRIGKDELSELVRAKSGLDFGEIQEMIPLRRGASGRITLLRIVGDRLTAEIGKELEIRRILSPSHLYSSAFVVEKADGEFILHGAGWGHGVGLCQIGAAMMAARGFGYRQILSHYYPHASLKQIP
ncbi:MAG: SpoIID/LytB domain-containing protein [Clostridium sp.]|nr:SpoIID/LytB domain-containing protein [Clostridium sp.]